MSVRLALLVAVATLLSLPVVGRSAEGDIATPALPVAAARTRAQDEPATRLREGTRLNDVSGQFDFAGDRIAFFPSDSKDSYRVLENLALERVSRILGESRQKPEWSVSGVVTEFRGVNYLLVTRAVIKTAPATSLAP